MARLVASAAAAAAVRHSAKKRPKMSQIGREGAEGGDVAQSLEDLNEGVRPGQSMAFGTAAATSSYKAPGPYTSDMERIRQAPMAIPEYGGAVTRFGHPSPIRNEGSFDDDDDLIPVKIFSGQNADPDLDALLPDGFLSRTKGKGLVVKSWAAHRRAGRGPAARGAAARSRRAALGGGARCGAGSVRRTTILPCLGGAPTGLGMGGGSPL